MNTPTLQTERLILRKFTEEDMKALFLILKDEEVNRFLPWYPVKNMEETKKFYEERYASKYIQPQAYAYAICLKSNNFPIGYIKVDMEEHHDFGYGLRKEFWHQGIVTEAAKAVVEQVKKDGLPYITATHDRNNLRSGNVMQKVGMKYCYSYEEQWQPKDFPVIFRMYQLNFDGNDSFVYKKYWDTSSNHFVEAEGDKSFSECKDIDKWQELYEKAKEQYHPEDVSPFVYAHHVVCALEAENGEIFTGFCIESCCGVLDLCAERTAALNMYINSGQTVIKRLIVFRDKAPFGEGSGMPCGACREFLMQLDLKNREMEIMVDYDTRETVTLGELMPDWWGMYRYKEE